MDWILSFSTTILIFIAALFILVTIHEFGHFIAAKFFKMRVDQFSIGFPPKVFGFQKGETEYVIGATPLGGYVKIAGMIDESMDTEFMDEEIKPDEFRGRPVWQRMIVITAGVIFNAILAVIIYTGIAWSYGETVTPIQAVESIYVPEGSVADQIGLKTGDQLLGINGKEVAYFEDLLNPSSITEKDVTFLVNRAGEQVTVQTPDNFLDLVGKEGFIDHNNILPSQISDVVEGSPADQAGISGGDKIVAINGEPVGYWVQLVEKIQNAGGAIQLDVLKNGITERIEVTPDPEDNTIGIYPADPVEIFQIEHIEYNLGGSVVAGLNKTNNTFFGIVQGLGKMFSGDISVRDNLGGPVAIASVTREATDRGGWLGFWNITAFLSITLAIMNMLPIPALDGGHFMFLVYEGITRREPSAKVRMGMQQLGFILLIGLFILITFNDILRTFGVN